MAAVQTRAKNLDALEAALETQDTPARPAVRKSATPAIRSGENSLTSRPFFLSNLVGYLSGQVGADQAKVELEQTKWFTKSMREMYGGVYNNENSHLVPIAWDALPQQIAHSEEGRVFKSMATGANQSYDPDELRHMIRKSDLSAYSDSLGGSFVAPPQFGEPIELLRNEEVFLAAGARRVALPPQGQMTFPRLTTPTTANPQPEATNGTYSDVNTGDVTLSAKAYSVYVRMSNQLIKFAPNLANAMIQADMAKSTALKIDLDALEGPAGGQNNIRGLITYSGINQVTATTVGANGNTIGRKDGKRMMSKVFAANAKFKAWIMRYEMFLNDISELSADAVTPGDKAGMYLFDLTRSIRDNQGTDFNWLKFPVHCSNQVSRTRTKGSSSALTYVVGGDFNDYLFGMHGAMELTTNPWGDTAWRANQQELRAISYADAAPRHEASFVLCDSLVYTS